MKNKNLSWAGALLVFALLLWCTAATPGKIADPATYTCAVYSSALSLLPPVVAIVLALNTKEVYTSLLVGIATGALLYANGNLELALTTLFFNEDGGMVSKLSDSSNVGILVFLVMLGILVALMNKAGGSAAFGRWASTHIHTRAGAQFATLLLGVMIFVDDYFNCLTVGSVMRPVTDRQKISRAKLAYLIDATAAPICIIAPVSSWAAAVTSSVPEGSGINGFTMFLRTIPYNYYAIMTIVMCLFLIFTGTDYGSMKRNEENAKNGDLFTTEDRPYGDDMDDGTDTNGHVVDLVAPVIVLIAACIFGMIYSGGFFEGVDFVSAFANCNASMGLVMGSSIALLFTFVFYRTRQVMTFQDFAACIPDGFKAMVSPMLILTLAWTLSGMTGLLGAKYYVADLLSGSAAALQYLLPFIIFIVAVFLAFATGTSWGTFSILIPIVCHAFPEGEMLVLSIAACLSGAVCGDHCSPISDTTIMASAGAHCSHVNHVSTQLPYALTVAAISAGCYVLAGVGEPMSFGDRWSSDNYSTRAANMLLYITEHDDDPAHILGFISNMYADDFQPAENSGVATSDAQMKKQATKAGVSQKVADAAVTDKYTAWLDAIDTYTPKRSDLWNTSGDLKGQMTTPTITINGKFWDMNQSQSVYSDTKSGLLAALGIDESKVGVAGTMPSIGENGKPIAVSANK